MSHLLDVIDGWATSQPDRAAFECRDLSLDYASLREQSDALAAYLANALPADRSPIVVYGHKQPVLLVCFLACVKAGHPYVPVDEHLPASRVARILARCGARAVLSADELPPGVGGDRLVVAGDRLLEVILGHLGRRAPRDRRVAGADPFYVIYTSGSTGEPKGVSISLDNLAGFVAWASSALGLGRGRRILNQAPFSFDLSVMDTYGALFTGGTVVSVDRRATENPLDLRDVLGTSGVDVWVSTPSFAEMCVADRAFSHRRLPRLSAFAFCGEPLPVPLVRALRQRFPRARIYNTYGPTEATVAVTAVEIDDDVLERFDVLPLGAPRHDTTLSIVDGDGQPVADGERGELIITGPCVSAGYWLDPEQTSRAFFGEPPRRSYRTGDLGYSRAGQLFFAGRRDSQIKLFGYRIELDDIEANLCRLEGVANAVVLPVLRDGRCDGLVGVVVPSPSYAPDPGQLRSELAHLLPRYMVPREIRVRPRFPTTSNGKVDRQQLARDLDEAASG